MLVTVRLRAAALIKPKRARSGSASTLNQVNNQDNDSNYEQ